MTDNTSPDLSPDDDEFCDHEYDSYCPKCGLASTDNTSPSTGAQYVTEVEIELSPCCGAYTTYFDATLICKVCYEGVE